MINTPYTEWEGDDVHGRRPRTKACWVRLDGIYVRDLGTSTRVMPEGLDMTGTAPGLLVGWFPNARGGFVGVVNYQVSYADGRRDKVHAVNQLVPDYLLRERT